MRVLILGGTGPSGILLIEEALSAKHVVVVYARNPQKLPEHLRTHPDVTIVKGELEDAESLDAALAGGTDAVLSALGPFLFRYPPGTPIAVGYRSVLAAMRRAGVRRLLALGTPSIADENDKASLVYSAMVAAVAFTARSAYKDIVAVGEVIRACDDMEWTIVRVPALKNDQNREVLVGYIGDGGAGDRYTLARLGFAVFMLQELEKGEWIKRAPLITSA
ncbi:NAD(P)-binding protein [Russula earlei]|uniref:NAD(P)-binding protein n=1 Tax=Russula earlei TaxID=71964 RepID=A0ACC0UBF0_9AGAM|nr:NAD(P)-binding protein [Russula earlei]